MDPVKWGIVSTGGIAHTFAEAVKRVEGSVLQAVGSRSQASADRFADSHNIPLRFAAYEDLAASTEVDIYYVATPQPFHMENTLLCLQQGKPVLCEKPFALNAAQAKRMMDAAAQKDVFLMEAMWMLCFPAIRKLIELVRGGVLGELTRVQADFNFNIPFDPAHRLYNKELGGGALLDLGVYPVTLAMAMFDAAPEQVHSTAVLGRTEVDEQNAILLAFPGGGQAVLTSGFRSRTPNRAQVHGSKGWIELDDAFFCSNRMTLYLDGKEPEVFTYDHGGPEGFVYQVQHVQDCLAQGLKQSPWIPWDHTLRIMELMDGLRSSWGLKYQVES